MAAYYDPLRDESRGGVMAERIGERLLATEQVVRTCRELFLSHDL
jgi:hypothetical protein